MYIISDYIIIVSYIHWYLYVVMHIISGYIIIVSYSVCIPLLIRQPLFNHSNNETSV
jgi:hypothetical protein